jgi:DUF438 domain-containing protein
MHLSEKTRIGELLKTYPFLLDYLAGYTPEFEKLRNPILRNTFGRIATLKMASSMGKVPLDKLLEDLRRTIEERTGEQIELQSPAAVLEEESGRLELLKGIIKDLHAGISLDERAEGSAIGAPRARAEASIEDAKLRFAALLEHVDPTEIAKMEQQLMADGMPQAEIKRLCDVHVQVFKASLDQQTRPELQGGHPVHTFLAENRALEVEAETLRRLLEAIGAGPLVAEQAAVFGATVERLATIERHYLRKENQLFPFLEKHGIVGPPQVMWAIHDEVRALLKEVRAALRERDGVLLAQKGPALCQTLVDMIYKEDNILFPMALSILEEADWIAIAAGERELGFALVTPGEDWRPAAAAGATSTSSARDALLTGMLPLDTGLLSLEQVNLMLRSLPVDLSFVDEHDEVRYYSEGPERIFPRSPGVIGRKVQNCHPAKSVATVNRILQAFRAGEKNVAEFWLTIGGRFLQIRYFALRDPKGSYRGCLEVSQDLTPLRALEGDRRLLSWDETANTEREVQP